MTPTKARRSICTAAMIFSGYLMKSALDWYTTLPPETLTQLNGVDIVGMFASIAAIFKFALDQFDGKVDS